MEISNRRVLRLSSGGFIADEDPVIIEEPIELRLGGVPLAVLMRTPGDDEALALGFCLTEGILLRPEELVSVEPLDDGSRYDLGLAPGLSIDPEQFRRNAYTTSSCGVCGKASIDAVRVAAPRSPKGPRMTIDDLSAAIRQLESSQPLFDRTGGLHGAAIVDPGGRLLASAEDVGRHNAVDKAIGKAAPLSWPIGESILAVSGRVSFEIAQKAAVSGIPIVVGVSAASSLALDLAEELDLSVIGWARDGHMVVYAGSHRFT